MSKPAYVIKTPINARYTLFFSSSLFRFVLLLVLLLWNLHISVINITPLQWANSTIKFIINGKIHAKTHTICHSSNDPISDRYNANTNMDSIKCVKRHKDRMKCARAWDTRRKASVTVYNNTWRNRKIVVKAVNRPTARSSDLSGRRNNVTECHLIY